MEATGRQAIFSAVSIFRFDNGEVVEIWNHRDDLGLAEQVGGADPRRSNAAKLILLRASPPPVGSTRWAERRRANTAVF
jgi:hypothetical protein